MPIIQSYCKIDKEIFFIHSINVINGQFAVKLRKCIKNNLLNNDLWVKNKYIQTPQEITLSPQELRKSVNLNEKCLSCKYYKSNNFHLYKLMHGLNTDDELDDFSWGICSLRNDAFENGCMELFVDCPYIKNNNKNFFQVPTPKELESFLIVYNKVINIKNDMYISTYNSGFYILTPEEFSKFKSLICEDKIVFVDYINDITDNTVSFEYIDFREFTIDQLYYYFMHHINCALLSEKAEWGIVWESESTTYKLYGGKDIIKNYNKLIDKNI